jgi:hypothetical protein
LRRLPELEAKKAANEKHKARSCTTDPEATVMKMADGGFRPAYNLPYSADTATQVITGVEAVTAGSDAGQLPPMLEQIHDRFGVYPKTTLVDGSFARHEDIEAVSKPEVGCTVYAPVPEPKEPQRDRYIPLPGDSEAVAEWRKRMGKPEAKAIDKERAATVECVNAQARNRGLVQLPVRGRLKVKAVALWFAVAHNVSRAVSLGTQRVRSALTVRAVAVPV